MPLSHECNFPLHAVTVGRGNGIGDSGDSKSSLSFGGGRQTASIGQSNFDVFAIQFWNVEKMPLEQIASKQTREEVVVYLVVSIGILHILFVARSNAIADDLSRQQQQEIVDNFQDVIRLQRDRFNGLWCTRPAFLSLILLIWPCLNGWCGIHIVISTRLQISKQHTVQNTRIWVIKQGLSHREWKYSIILR